MQINKFEVSVCNFKFTGFHKMYIKVFTVPTSKKHILLFYACQLVLVNLLNGCTYFEGNFTFSVDIESN